MPDWKKLGAARGVPDDQMERITPALEALEKAFRPQLAKLPHDEEPATMFRISAEDEA